MGPARRIVIGLAALVLAAAGFAGGRTLLRPSEEIAQPIAFSHKKHVDVADCDTCHQFYAEGAHSGLPSLSTCMMCHEEPQTDSPEEELVRSLAEAGREDVFRKLFRLADHTFYSHRLHVTVAGLECEACHGGIAESDAPPQTPLVRIDMDFCLDCHQQRGASTSCTRCHR